MVKTFNPWHAQKQILNTSYFLLQCSVLQLPLHIQISPGLFTFKTYMFDGKKLNKVAT